MLECPYCGGEPDWLQSRDQIDWSEPDEGVITTYTRCTNPSCPGANGFTMTFGFVANVDRVHYETLDGKKIRSEGSYNWKPARRSARRMR